MVRVLDSKNGDLTLNCPTGGSFYEQSPLKVRRQSVKEESDSTNADIEELKSLQCSDKNMGGDEEEGNKSNWKK